MLDLEGYQNPWAKSDINLYQWCQVDSGACFNLLYNARKQSLSFDVRCETGEYVDAYNKIYLTDSQVEVWHEFVVHTNWSHQQDGFFRVLQNGNMVVNYEGPTRVTNGRDRISDHPQIYRYGGDDIQPTAWEQYEGPSTVWFDDMMRSRSMDAIQGRMNLKFQSSKIMALRCK